jgi:protein-S-isoprenylcysteine O-methyltransferase Ste14
MKEATTVGIGVGIFLIAIGAIFTFALDVNVGWLDLDVVGWVLMLAGVVGLILTLWFWQSRKRTTVVRDTRAATPQTYGTPAPPAPPVQGRVEEYHEVRRDDPGY